jgi:hypothetical protein
MLDCVEFFVAHLVAAIRHLVRCLLSALWIFHSGQKPQRQARRFKLPVGVAEIEKVVASMARLDPALAAKLRDILGIKK